METGPEKPDVTTELDEAVQSFNQGKFEHAKKVCDRILAENPDNVTALSILGGSLARTGKITQAIEAAERACLLSPGNAAFYSNLGNLHRAKGNVYKSIVFMAHAVVSDTKRTAYQVQFARMIEHLEFHKLTAETDVIKQAIRTCMGNRGIDTGSFSTAWHSLLLLDPVFQKFASLTRHGNFTEQADEVDIEALAEPLTDPFLLPGLSSLHATSEKYERIITFLRHFFISRFADYDAETFLPFLCALAEHCNLNEHVYRCTQQEQLLVAALEKELDPAAKLDASTMARVALISCYKDLMQLDCASTIAEASAASHSDAFMLLVKNAITTPAKTREYHDTIPKISSANDSLQNAVSSAVAQQYEENPYPRWRHLDIPVLTDQHRARGKGKEILIAGCGTGYEPLNMAVHYPEARIVGVDLSVPSLAYGKQKAAEFGIGNVEFIQADILQLEGSGWQFDLISCAGVLHHMEDPVEGWRKLLSCLKPDGFMKVALYSEVARQSVVMCRNWIEEQGIASTPEGIREFRQAIMEMAAENPLRDIMSWTDFYSMSMCRDLVFHVQEHRVSLPWIQSVLDDLGLCCLLMRIGNPVFRKEYLSMYPGDPGIRNLGNLNEYEKHNPATFRDMYKFWCCRKESVTAERPPEWFYTLGLS